MIDWAARARAELGVSIARGTARTDKSPVSSVSSAAPEHIPASCDTSPCAAAEPARRSGNPYMTPEQGDECHQGGWDDAEIEVFLARSTRLRARGRADAEHLAERLTLRDRQADDRRMCLECRELDVGGRCAAARRGALAHADRLFAPTQNILMRCPAFRGSEPHHP